jgi:hypothetical protein
MKRLNYKSKRAKDLRLKASAYLSKSFRCIGFLLHFVQYPYVFLSISYFPYVSVLGRRIFLSCHTRAFDTKVCPSFSYLGYLNICISTKLL